MCARGVCVCVCVRERQCVKPRIRIDRHHGAPHIHNTAPHNTHAHTHTQSTSKATPPHPHPHTFTSSFKVLVLAYQKKTELPRHTRRAGREAHNRQSDKETQDKAQAQERRGSLTERETHTHTTHTHTHTHTCSGARTQTCVYASLLVCIQLPLLQHAIAELSTRNEEGGGAQ